MLSVAYQNTERGIKPKLEADNDVVVKTYYPREKQPPRPLSFREQWAAQQARERREAEAIRSVIAQYRAIDCMKVSVKDIIREVAKQHDVSVQDILGARRSKNIVLARHEAICAAARARPDMSLPALGRHFGGRDHTTILHALRKGGVVRVRSTASDRET